MVHKQIFKLLAVSAISIALTACGGYWTKPNGGGGGTGQGGGGGQGRNRPKASGEEVKAAFANMLQAFQKKDVGALESMFADNSTVAAPPLGPQVMIWADAKPIMEQAIKNSGDVQFSSGSSGVVGVDRDMGWIAAPYHVRENTPKGPNEGDGVMTVVFRKAEDGYKIVAFHANRIPTVVAPPAAKKK